MTKAAQSVRTAPGRMAKSAAKPARSLATLAIVAGLVGSFVGGLLISLLSGDGLDLKPSGIIGSIIGAILVTLAWNYWEGRRQTTA